VKSEERCGETEEPLLALQHVGARALEHPALPDVERLAAEATSSSEAPSE
jgi:hypothetical protein